MIADIVDSTLADRMRAKAQFKELLLIAGSVAHNSGNATYRAAACREVDRQGLEWTSPLSNANAQLVEAIVASVRAHAGASNPNARTAIGRALKELVLAGHHGKGADPPIGSLASAAADTRSCAECG